MASVLRLLRIFEKIIACCFAIYFYFTPMIAYFYKNIVTMDKTLVKTPLAFFTLEGFDCRLILKLFKVTNHHYISK